MTQEVATTEKHGAWWFFRPRPHASGISSFGDMKFYVVWLLYLASFCAFAQDPFFHRHGAFVYQQGLVTLILAAVVAMSFNWEMCLFGKPTGANLLLHLIQILPLSLFMARITARASVPEKSEALVGRALEVVKGWSGMLVGDVTAMIPAWMTDLFTNWRICVLLVFVLFFLCFRHLALKVASVVCVILVTLGSVIAKGAVGSHLILGLILLGCGMAIQFCRYDRILYFENVFHRLHSSASLDSTLAAVILRTMTALQDQTRVSEKNLLSLVRAEYDPERRLSFSDVQLIAGEVLQRMVYEYDLVVIRSDAEGMFLQSNERLHCHDSLLTHLAIVPRVALAVAASVVWVLLPVDLIPDSLPFVGMLDDVTVAIFSGIVLKNMASVYGLNRR
ncbi:MAG: DUF1232 domain-containing protein [Victivallales bacterium]|nr:DUF1232 domain-containing protein [Victivallales bacterium]